MQLSGRLVGAAGILGGVVLPFTYCKSWGLRGDKTYDMVDQLFQVHRWSALALAHGTGWLVRQHPLVHAVLATAFFLWLAAHLLVAVTTTATALTVAWSQGEAASCWRWWVSVAAELSEEMGQIIRGDREPRKG